MGMILRIASSRIVGQGDIVGRSGYFSLNLSANSVMRGRLDARRTLKSLVADLRFYILNSVYNEQELAILFSSLTEQSSRFKEQILENYLSAKNVGELASLLGYGVTNFRAKFKEQFGVSVYRWLLNRKSQHIIYRITVYGDEFSQIIDDFGFSSPSHFNKFCRSQYGLTPCELRKKLKTNNNS